MRIKNGKNIACMKYFYSSTIAVLIVVIPRKFKLGNSAHRATKYFIALKNAKHSTGNFSQPHLA
jgi:hypothetical protein